MIFIVTSKATGEVVYEYPADAAIEWNGMEFATHDHVEQMVPDQDGSVEAVAGRVFTKLEYLRRFTGEERVTIRAVAKTNPTLEDYLAMMEMAEEINTGDADTIAAVNMLEQAGLIGAGRAEEILNG